MVYNDRTSYLQELIRLSSEATLLISTPVFKEEDVFNRFLDARNALNYLKNDDDLVISVKNLDNNFTNVNIKIRGDNNDETID